MSHEIRSKIAAASLALLAVGSAGFAFAYGGGGGHGGGGGGGHGGGSGGGGHFGGGSHAGGMGHGFGGRGGYGGGGHFGGGYGGGYRGSYGGWHGGWHGGGYGYRGGWRGYGGWRGGYGGWGWGGLGFGLYFATLPFYYSTLWAEGVPYYYADDNYFQWDGTAGQYVTVDPPAEVKRQAASLSPDLIAYPKNGQTDAQQATDKSDCRNWAAAQSGFDPAHSAAEKSTGAEKSTSGSNKQPDYMRAQAACLEGRGYSVE